MLIIDAIFRFYLVPSTILKRGSENMKIWSVIRFDMCADENGLPIDPSVRFREGFRLTLFDPVQHDSAPWNVGLKIPVSYRGTYRDPSKVRTYRNIQFKSFEWS